MSKTRNKTRSEGEHLNGIIRQLKSENRNLRKRIKELEKWERNYENKILEEDEPELVLEKVEKCSQCKSGNLKYQDFKFVRYLVCDNVECKYKEKVK